MNFPTTLHSAIPEENLMLRWRRLTLIIYPLGLLGLLLGCMGELHVQVSSFDLLIHPPMIALTSLMGIVLLLWPHTFSWVVSLMVPGISVFILVRVIGILFLAPPGLAVGYEMAEAIYWTPIIYIFAFLVPEVRGGRLVSIVFTTAFFLLTLIYIFFHPFQSASEATDLLIQVNLVNIVQLILSLGLVRLREQYSQAKLQLQFLDHTAHTDLVTGLPNRLSLQHILENALSIAQKNHEQLAILFIDIDRFKLINDTLGHSMGDLALETIATRLSEVLRDDDVVARISGDEFVVIIRKPDQPEAVKAIAERILARLSETFDLQGQNHSISASIGGSLFPDDAEDAETLIRHADSAMYKVKKRGKNGFEMYEKADAALERYAQLEKDLTIALENQQFFLTYQPMYNLQTGKLVKLEALLRWQHPIHGLISPAEFIPVAETSGLIIPLGSWVLEKACEQAKIWNLHQKAIRISINVSSLQFSHPGFFAVATQALKNHALPGTSLELEITESIVINQSESAKEMLLKLQELGIYIAIDDFGTGYSSLAYLRDLAIDTIKIDRSFVSDLVSEGRDVLFSKALIETIIGLAKYLDLEIVAEGIETESQRTLLKHLGCHIGQGYLFSKPITAAEFDQFFQHRPLYLSSSAIQMN